MGEVMAPKELIDTATNILELRSIKDWQYRGDYLEMPNSIVCTHGGLENKPESSYAKITGIAIRDNYYGVGQCNICGKVLWCRVRPR